MAMIQICDLCDTKLKSKYYVCSLFTFDTAQDVLNRANERYELCPDCYESMKAFIDCLRLDPDVLLKNIAGDDHDES